MKLIAALLSVVVIFCQRSLAQPQVSAPFIRCPDEICFTEFRPLFDACAGLIGAGCKIISCEGRGFRCVQPRSQNGGTLPEDDTITIGEQIAPRTYEISVSEDFTFMVNLSFRPIKSDLYVLVDATGGSSFIIEFLLDEFSRVIDEFNIGGDNAFGVGFYRDEESPETDNGFVNVQSITKNRQQILQAVDSLVATGGFDFPEANLVALHRLATDDSIGWRSGARRTIVYIGDAPGHEPTCDRGVVLNRQTVINELNAKNITVSAVSFVFGDDGIDNPTIGFGECSEESFAPRGQGTEIVEQTGGELIQTSAYGELVSFILKVVRDLPTRYELDSSDCDGLLRIAKTPPVPVMLNPSEMLKVEHKLTLARPCSTSRPGNEFECSLRYSASGGRSTESILHTIKIIGCRV